MSLLIVGIDVTIVNVALPSIRSGLHASLSGLQWSVDAYTLVLGSLLLTAGAAADRFGRRRVFQLGLTVFTFASALCSVAPSAGALIAFRCLQAVGASMLNPVALSIVSNTFTEPKERARALGIWGAVVGVSLALGPVLGGVLVDGIGWRAIFWVNVPIGIAAIVLAWLFVPESRAERARRFDPWGQVLTVVMLASLIFAVIEGPTDGWGSPRIVGTFVIAVAVAITLVTVELRRREPLIEMRFFRSLPFSGAALTATLAFGALGGFLFVNTLYLQDGRGYSALHAGLLTLPMAVTTCVFAPLSGRLVGSRGPRLPLLISGVAIAIGASMLLGLGADTSLPYLLAAYVAFGLGFGLVNAPISNAAVSGSRQVGSSLGVAVTGSLVAGATDANLAGATHAAWGVLALCGIGIVAVGYASTTSRAVDEGEVVREMLAAETAPAPE
jgi:EmrB/QacA subfamily drug resistance transporter